MPVAFTAVGTTLVATIIDDNFETVQDLLRSGLDETYLTGQFNRYHVLRYVGGRLVSATSFANPLLLQETYNSGNVDGLYRYGIETDPSEIQSGLNYLDTTTTDWATSAMEFLGRPGPSFYFDFQEDEIPEADLAGVAGWPLANWPFTRYPAQLCFSPWLTVPGASLKTWVDAPCVARIRATTRTSLNFCPVGKQSIADRGVSAGYGSFDYSRVDDNVNWRAANWHRFALIADTNPKLFTDEFANTNPNIKTPGTSTTAPYVSWKLVQQQAFYCSQRQEIKLTGEVALAGRRDYNFSFKMKGGGIRGWVKSVEGVDTWDSGFWRNDPDNAAGPGIDSEWSVAYYDIFDTDYSTAVSPLTQRVLAPNLPYFNLWESGTIHVEFDYSRTEAYVTDSTHPDITPEEA